MGRRQPPLPTGRQAFPKGEANISSLWKREAGRDFQSAKLIPFLMFVFTLVETGGKEGVPVVTVPVR